MDTFKNNNNYLPENMRKIELQLKFNLESN